MIKLLKYGNLVKFLNSNRGELGMILLAPKGGGVIPNLVLKEPPDKNPYIHCFTPL